MAHPQTTEKVDGLEALIEDHRTVQKLFTVYESFGDGDPQVRQETARDIVRELSVHAAVEEQFLYPLMRRSLPDGEAEVGKALAEHQEVKELLSRIEKVELGPDQDSLVRSVIESVGKHIQEEEDEEFPKLRAVATRDELLELGRNISSAKEIAPTRPHPRAPNTPPGNIVAGAVAGFVDRAKDAARAGREDAREQRK